MNCWQQIDAMVAEHRERMRPSKQAAFKLAPTKKPRTPLTLTEMTLIGKLQGCTFPPLGSHKRFVRELNMNSQLSESGRCYLAFIAHRYRRQWKPSDEEFEWMLRWKNY